MTVYFEDNRPSDVEYALLSSHVFLMKKDLKQWTPLQFSINNSLTEKGWKLVKQTFKRSSGYFGRIYVKESTKQFVVVHRAAADSTPGDLFGNLAQQKANGQKRHANEFAMFAFNCLIGCDAFKNYHQLSFTGHSLGAHFAELSVLVCNKEHEKQKKNIKKQIAVSAVTFESPGCLSAWNELQSHGGVKPHEVDIVNFTSYANFITTWDELIGTVYFVNPEIENNGNNIGNAFYTFANWLDTFCGYTDIGGAQREQIGTTASESMCSVYQWFEKHKNSLTEEPKCIVNIPNEVKRARKLFLQLKTNGGRNRGESLEKILRMSRGAGKILDCPVLQNAKSYHHMLPLRHFNFQEELKNEYTRKNGNMPGTIKFFFKVCIFEEVTGNGQSYVTCENGDIRLLRRCFSKFLVKDNRQKIQCKQNKSDSVLSADFIVEYQHLNPISYLLSNRFESENWGTIENELLNRRMKNEISVSKQFRGRFYESIKIWMKNTHVDKRKYSKLIEAIRKYDVYTAEKLRERCNEYAGLQPIANFHQPPLLHGKKWWPEKKETLSPSVERTVCGQPLIEKIYHSLSTSKKGEEKISIVGVGGIGKTTTALLYATKYEDMYDHILWINWCEESLDQTFYELASALDIKKCETLRTRAKKCFEILSYYKCLCIYDNVTSCDNILNDVIPKSVNGRIHTIITSRVTEWKNRRFTLNVFSPSDSVRFMEESLEQKRGYENKGDLRCLSDLLGGLPLAITLANAALYHTPRKPILEYIKDLTLTAIDDDGNWDYDENKHIYTTMKNSISLIREDKDWGNLAYNILLNLGYTRPNDVSLEFFEAVEKRNGADIRAAVDLVWKYSLISVEERAKGKTFVSIHRLLQKVLQGCEKHHEKERLGKILNAPVDNEYKIIPYLFVKNGKYEDLKTELQFVKTQLVDAQELRQKLNEGRYSDAVFNSKLIRDGIVDDGSTKIANAIAKYISDYNYAVCLEKNHQYSEAIERLKFLLAAPQPLSADLSRRFDSCCINEQLEMEFDILPLDHKDSITHILELQLCQLYLKINDDRLALEHFQFSRAYYHNLLTLCCYHCLAVKIISQDPVTIAQVTKIIRSIPSSVEVGGRKHLDEWVAYVNLLNEVNSDEIGGLYENAYKFMPFTQWENANMESVYDNMIKFCHAYYKQKKNDPICRSILRRIVGMENQFNMTFDATHDEPGITVNPLETDCDWTAGNSFATQFTHLTNTTQLNSLSLNGFSPSNRSVIFRSDLVFSLNCCNILTTLNLANVDLVGWGTERIHLPSINVFVWNKYIRTLNELERNKFFYKELGCIWKDISTMEKFHIREGVKAEGNSKSLELHYLELEGGIAYNNFKIVFIRNCSSLSTEKCECKFCISNHRENPPQQEEQHSAMNSFLDAFGFFKKLEKGRHYTNVEQLSILYSTVKVNNFDLGQFNSLSQLKIMNHKYDDLIVDVKNIKNVNSAILSVVRLNCVEEIEIQLTNNRGWQLEDCVVYFRGTFVKCGGLTERYVIPASFMGIGGIWKM